MADPSASRKWKLVNKQTMIFIVAYALTVVSVLVALKASLIDSGGAVSLWSTSLTMFSGGVLGVTGWYFTENVKQKKFTEPQ
jgi:hypothetical protein